MGYLAIDEIGRINEANVTAANILGIKKELLINKSFSLFIDDSSQDPYRIHLSNVFKRRDDETCEVNLKKVVGSTLYAQLQSTAVGTSYFLLILSDITHHKHIINLLTDATFAIDLEGRITLWNRAAEEFTGVTAADMLGKGDYDHSIPFYGVRRPILIDMVLNPSEEIEQLYPHVKRENGMVTDENYARSIHRREETYMLAKAAPIYDSRGNIIGAIESVRDITKRKKMEEALLDGEQKLNSIIYGSPIPQFALDREHRVIYWNKALEEISRIKAREIIGTKQQWRAFYSAERPSMADLLMDGGVETIAEWYRGKWSKSKIVTDAYEAEDYFPALGKDGKWLYFTAAVIKDSFPQGQSHRCCGNIGRHHRAQAG